MPMFRKRPVVIEAHQVPPEGEDCSKEMCVFIETSERDIESQWDGSLLIYTLEGSMEASPGDWIIKGVAGEFYPIKDEILWKTYERVDDA